MQKKLHVCICLAFWQAYLLVLMWLIQLLFSYTATCKGH
jgi:hypothetical protein